MVDLTPLVASFGLIFLAELGDKTQLAVITLAACHTPRHVMLGAAAAFTLLSLGAVLVGQAVLALVPVFWVQVVSGVLFLAVGVVTLLRHPEEDELEEDEACRTPMYTAFTLILLMEMGDKTQLAAILLTATYAAPVLVFLGVAGALILISALGVYLGAKISERFPRRTIENVAGSIFILFGVAILGGILVDFVAPGILP